MLPSKIEKRKSALNAFFQDRLWRMNPADMPWYTGLWIWILRIVSIVINGFIESKLVMRASALTYISLIALVPVLALLCTVAKAFDVDETLRDTVIAQFQSPGQIVNPAVEVLQDVFQQVNNIQQNDWTKLGAFALLIVMIIVIRTLSTVERTFNDLWGIKRSRSIGRKISDYISVLVLVPLSIAAGSAVDMVLHSTSLVNFLSQWTGPFFTLYETFLNLGTLFMIWVGFVFLYLFMPNTRVKFSAALAAGIIAGTLWYGIQQSSILLISFSFRKTLYGTFASVPLFLIWMYVSWMVVLLGAQISFAFQNVRTYRKEGEALPASTATRERVALMIATSIAQIFHEGREDGWDHETFHQEHKIPIRLINDILDLLVTHHVLTHIPGPPSRYMPARSLNTITARHVLDAIRGTPDPYVRHMPQRIGKFSLELDQMIRTHGESITLADLIPT